jgi:hypothetical protein
VVNSTALTGDLYEDAISNRFTDTFTIYQGVTANTKGSVTKTHVNARAGHTSIPALISPGDVGNARMKRQEMMTSMQTTEMEYHYVLLLGAWPLISLEDEGEGNGDGVRWAIVAIDIDQTKAFTKLLVERMQPGNL